MKVIIVIMTSLICSCAPVFEAYIGINEKFNSDGVKILNIDTCGPDRSIKHITYVDTGK